MLLFRSEEHARRWAQARDLAPGGTMSLATGWALASEWYGDRLGPGWRRKTLDEAEECFVRLGLTGAFWSLRPPG